MSREKQKQFCFPLYWLVNIEILLMVYESQYNWVVWSPIFTKQPGWKANPSTSFFPGSQSGVIRFLRYDEGETGSMHSQGSPDGMTNGGLNETGYDSSQWYNQLRYCWWKKSCTTWDVKNLVNNGINYQSQLVSLISEPSMVQPVEIGKNPLCVLPSLKLTASLHLKMDGWKTSQRPICKCEPLVTGSIIWWCLNSCRVIKAR